MKSILKYFFSLGMILFLQTEFFGQCMPTRSDDCDGANVLCGLTAMNGYTCQNADYPNMSGPPSLCPGWGAPTNIGWWAFVTSGGNVCITVNYNNCKFPPPGGTNGIQLGIYEDCTYSNLIICDATCPGPTGTKTICGFLTACKVYYFFVDGCNGDVCDFTLTTTGGASPKLDPIGKINNIASQKIEVCKGACKQKFEVKAQKAGCESMYDWTLDGVDQGVNSNKITLDFPDEGVFTLCATAIIGTKSSVCDKDGPECIAITVKRLADKTAGPIYICQEKIPYNWHGEMVDMSGMVRKEFRDANCCYFDSVVDFVVLPTPTAPNFYYIGCGPNDPFKDPITGRLFNTCENQTLVALPASTKPYRCDSSYLLTSIFLKYNVIFLEKCVSQEIEISPEIINQTASCGGGESFSYSYNWYLRTDPTKKSIGTDEKILVSKKDEYCFELIVDAKLGNISKVCRLEFCENLNEDDLQPRKTCPIGDTLSCIKSINQYSIDSSSKNDKRIHFWTITNGVITSPNPNDSSHIEVQWSNTPGIGKVCYSYTNDCGTSPECCINVLINASSKPNAGIDQTFCGLSGSFNGKKDQGGFWQALNNNGNSIIQDSTNDKSKINVSQFGLYKYVWIEKFASCISTDTVALSFNDSPSKGAENIICNSNNLDYIIKFPVNGGTPPYSVVKGNGMVNLNNEYVSGSIINNIKDTIIIKDANNCSFTFIHDYECKCLNQIGKFDTTTQNLCEDQILSVLYDTTGQILDKLPADTIIFFIYTDPLNPIASKVRNISKLIVPYDPSLTYNIRYYIGAYLGKKDGNGGIDFNQSCVRITKFGQAFVFYQKPNPSAGRDTNICGNTILLNGISTVNNGKINWKIISGGTAIFNNKNSALTEVTILGNYGDYVFEIEEDNNGICINTDQVKISFNPVPEISNVDKICVDLTPPGKYIVKANLRNGTAPYTLLSTGGKIVNNTWCSDTLNSLSNFDILIKDANGCQTLAISDNYNCNCGIIDAGKLDSTPTYLCEGQCVNIKSILRAQINNIEDTIMYVLHTGFYKNAIDTFYSVNDLICFNKATMRFGANNIYYISRIVGDDISPKDGIIDPTDPCLRVSNNQSMVWFAQPEAIIDSAAKITCTNKSIILNGSNSLTGSGGLAIYHWTTTNGNFVDPSKINSSSIEINQAGSYELEITDPITNCKHKSKITITTDTIKPSVKIAIPEILNCDKTLVQIIGNSSSSGVNYSALWNGPGIVGNTNNYSVEAKTAGFYSLKITNKINGCIDSSTIEVKEDKILPHSVINALGTLGCTNSQVDLDGSKSSGGSGQINSYTWTALNGKIISGQSSSKITIGKPGGIYILIVKDGINGCVDSDTIQLTDSGNPLKDILLNALDPTCFGQKDGEIKIIDVIDSLNAAFTDVEFSINGSAFSSLKNYAQKPEGTYTIVARDKMSGCLFSKVVKLTEPSKLAISVIKQKVVNQGDLVDLNSMLISLLGGTNSNGQYKDTTWFNIDDNIDWKSKLIYEADKTRDFIVTGIDQSDCEITAQFKIIVKILREVWWPTVFSPNQDGINDFFNIYGKRIKSVRVLNLFDRWGNQVFAANNLQVNATNQGWDGNYKGERALPGVYTFYAQVEYEDTNISETISGEVTLLR